MSKSYNINNKIVVILGPTTSGKTKLAVGLARKFNSEIVSTDSRQVYKGMDVGTGKDLREFSNVECQMSNKKINKSKIGNRKSKIAKISYHLISVVSPKTTFNLAKYQKLAFKAIRDILKRRKLPILVGGSGLYLQAVVDRYVLPPSKPDKKLREKLEKMSAARLFKILSKLDFKKARDLNASERQNKKRLIRYVEIAQAPRVQALNNAKERERTLSYDFLVIGIKNNMDEIRKRIYKRLIERLKKEDMIGEVKGLHKQGLSWKRLESFGLEYKFISLYLRGKMNYNEMVQKLNIAIGQFAKRQMSWFRRWERQGARIHWIKNQKESEKIMKKFLK